MNNHKKIFLIAGEASGDKNGSILVDDIIKNNPNILFYGIGGTKLKSNKVDLVYDYSSINYIGFTNVIKNIQKIKKVLNKVVEYVRDLNPEIIILIDSPGFNLKFAQLVKKFYKGKIIYYISPQIWAWHKSRINIIKEYIDRMLVIFPFEVDFYKELNFNADYVGHPLVNQINDFLSKNKKEVFNYPNICLLPGSRLEEIRRILPTLANVSELLRKQFNAEIKLIYPENINPIIYKNILKGRYCKLLPNTEENHLTTLLNSDLVLSKFGTTTLELALLNIPFISVYKAGIFNYRIAKFFSQIKYVSMPNILLGKEIVKEFIQYDMTTDNIHLEAKKILEDKSYRNKIIKELQEVRNLFNNTPVKKTAAEIILEELRN